MATLLHSLSLPSCQISASSIPSTFGRRSSLKFSQFIRGLKLTPISTTSPSIIARRSGRVVCESQDAAFEEPDYWEDRESMGNNVGEGKLVCVTGASGYIASWIVKFLLLRGYTVKGTVRDPNDPRKVDHLLNLDGATERLQLIKADLQEEGSFDEAVEGCEGIFHTASPCYFDPIDPQTELIDPAVKGTLNVLRSCAKSSNVKRVVLTSSFAAVSHTGKPLTPDVIVDETWFSSPDICRNKKRWYHVSKILAEEAARKFAKENSIDLVVLNPAFVIGSLLQPSLNETCAVIFNLIKGQTYPNYSAGWVNVKDVANAHIQAFEIPSASGRYILVERVEHYSEHVKILREQFPTLPLPEKCADDKPSMSKYQVSKEKAKSLGIEFIPLEVSLKETVESFKEKNFINF